MLSEEELQAIGQAMIQAEVLGGTTDARLVAGDVRALLATIRELQAQVPRWIPVSERLPEKPETWHEEAPEYLLLGEFGVVGNGFLCPDGAWVTPFSTRQRVVAWMPIPDTSQVLEP